MIDINEALETYLGTDHNGEYMPLRQDERIRKKYHASSCEVMAAIRLYLDFNLAIDWQEHDLNSAGDSFTKAVSTRFPELTPNVARSLGNRFTYGWR
jgi:hypothetical protein